MNAVGDKLRWNGEHSKSTSILHDEIPSTVSNVVKKITRKMKRGRPFDDAKQGIKTVTGQDRYVSKANRDTVIV